MKKTIYGFLTALCAAALLAGCNETLTYDHDVIDPPTIDSFTPETGVVEGQIVVTGTNLERVTGAKINGVPVKIKNNIGYRQIILVASREATSGKISLTNAAGTGVSATDFVYNYTTPTVTEFPASVEMGNKVTIGGQNMQLATNVYFTVPDEAPSLATIVSRTSYEIVVTVPYVSATTAGLAFDYITGPTTTALSGDVRSMTVVRNPPVIANYTSGQYEVGDNIDLTGTYLTKVESVTVGGFAATLSEQTATTLTITVPKGNYPLGVTADQPVVVTYFTGHDSDQIGTMNVYVPNVYHWRRIFLGSTDPSYRAAFFQPDEGVSVDNSLFATQIDPVAAQYYVASGTAGTNWTGLACSAANVPRITETQYNSVKPYFFMTAMSGRGLALSSPATSLSQPRNYRMNGATNQRLPLGNNTQYDCCGSVVMMMRLLYPQRAEELAVIDKVKGGLIDEINQTTFPVVLADNTVGGVKLIGTGYLPSGALRSQESTTGTTENPLTPTSGVAIWGTTSIGSTTVVPYGSRDNVIDAVVMCIYYSDKGYSAAAPASNIKKIGFLHITRLTLEDGASENTPALSNITFDMYWQKVAYN